MRLFSAPHTTLITWPDGMSCCSAKPQLLSLALCCTDHIQTVMDTANACMQAVLGMSWNEGMQHSLWLCKDTVNDRHRTRPAVHTTPVGSGKSEALLANTSKKQGQVTKDAVTYPFSANSVFLNHRRHSKAFGTEFQDKFSLLCVSQCLPFVCVSVCTFPYAWVSALSGEVGEISLQTE